MLGKMNWTLDLKQVEKEGFVMWNDHEIMPKHSVKLDRMKLVFGFLSVLTIYLESDSWYV